MKHLDIPTLVEMANHNDAVVMDGTMAPVHQLIADNDVVIAIWQDFTRPDGIGPMPIKGSEHLHTAFQSRSSFSGKVTAIKCECVEQALALLMTSSGPAN